MKVLLLYVAVALFLGMRAVNHETDSLPGGIPFWHLFLLAFLVGVSYLSLGVVWG